VTVGCCLLYFCCLFLQAGCCCRLHLAAQRLSSWHKSHARQVILMCQKDVKLVEARGKSEGEVGCTGVQKRSPSYWFASTRQLTESCLTFETTSVGDLWHFGADRVPLTKDPEPEPSVTLRMQKIIFFLHIFSYNLPGSGSPTLKTTFRFRLFMHLCHCKKYLRESVTFWVGSGTSD
jgi:hypothetical protein